MEALIPAVASFSLLAPVIAVSTSSPSTPSTNSKTNTRAISGCTGSNSSPSFKTSYMSSRPESSKQFLPGLTNGATNTDNPLSAHFKMGYLSSSRSPLLPESESFPGVVCGGRDLRALKHQIPRLFHLQTLQFR
ncbi:hypothetical protein FRC02_005917 [Tulasnella sp. 418]|nr:hypothetical protein FRC02_005917 [Tulasnella sp. 418]